METAIVTLYGDLVDDLERRDAITGDYEFDDAEFESRPDYYLGLYDALMLLVGPNIDYLTELETHGLSLSPIRDWQELGQYEPA